jgi:hypothetical protein
MFNDTDFERADKQERVDFKLAVMAFELVYSACTGYTIEYTQMELHCKADMRYTVSGETRVRKYCGEIKRRNKDIFIDDSLPLLVYKYTGLKRERKKGEKLFYISICNNSWWLFDLDDLDFNDVNISDWYIRDVQYTTKEPRYSYKPTIFIPVRQAKLHGICENGIPTDVISDRNSTQ